MHVRVTTFNVENLFNRYAFLDQPWEDRSYERFVQAIGVVSIASREGDLVPYATTEIQRNNTAQAILDAAPDILAVQEVENLYTLRNFNQTFLDGYFGQMISIDGNDPRGIDVGLLIRQGFAAEILNIRSHMDDAEDGETVVRRSVPKFGYVVSGAVFSRDCLEVDLRIHGKELTFLVNHLKAQDGKAASTKRRTEQAERVAGLATRASKEGRLPVVLGDLNVDPKTDKSLDSLLKGASTVLRDPFPADTWTHYYVPKKDVSRLDYILPHKSIQVSSTEIVRKGLTTKCKKYDGERYPTVGLEHTEASDHCPTTAVLEI